MYGKTPPQAKNYQNLRICLPQAKIFKSARRRQFFLVLGSPPSEIGKFDFPPPLLNSPHSSIPPRQFFQIFGGFWGGFSLNLGRNLFVFWSNLGRIWGVLVKFGEAFNKFGEIFFGICLAFKTFLYKRMCASMVNSVTGWQVR